LSTPEILPKPQTALSQAVSVPNQSTSIPLPLEDLLGSEEHFSIREKFKLVHISDLHISFQHYREHIKSFRLLLRALEEDGFDHLLITGDITSTGIADDFFIVREILDRARLLSSHKLTVVPGNHDIFGGFHRAVDVLSFPEGIRSVDYDRNLNLFAEAFAEAFEGVYRPFEDAFYPFVKFVGPFAIIGLNSIGRWSLLKNLFGSNGSLDDRQFEGLRALETSGILKGHIPIIALHHHFNGTARDNAVANNRWVRIEMQVMKLRKKRKLLRQFQRLGVKYVLHGHIHHNELYNLRGLQFANGGGAVYDDFVEFLKYNVVECVDGECHLGIVTLPIPFQQRVTSVLGREKLRTMSSYVKNEVPTAGQIRDAISKPAVLL